MIGFAEDANTMTRSRSRRAAVNIGLRFPGLPQFVNRKFSDIRCDLDVVG